MEIVRSHGWLTFAISGLRRGRFSQLQLAASGSQGCGAQRLLEARRVCLSRLVSAPRRTAVVNTTAARQRVEHGAAMTANGVGWRGFHCASLSFPTGGDLLGSGTGKSLLVGLAGVLEPTRLVAPTRVSMRPMYDAAFGVPFVHTVERDGVTGL